MQYVIASRIQIVNKRLPELSHSIPGVRNDWIAMRHYYRNLPPPLLIVYIFSSYFTRTLLPLTKACKRELSKAGYLGGIYGRFVFERGPWGDGLTMCHPRRVIG